MRCAAPFYLEAQKMTVPCGKCMYCLQARRNDWTFRLNQELKTAKAADFLTITYNNESLPTVTADGEFIPGGILCKRHLQLFHKRLRFAAAKVSQDSLRYYAVGEYGTRTIRPHYHSILFNLPGDLRDAVTRIWGLGHVHFGRVEPASIHYVTGYVVNGRGDYGGRPPPFSLISNRPGLGSGYLGTHTNWHLENMASYTNVNGMTARLPRYYREKIFSQEDRRQMRRVQEEISKVLYDSEIADLSKTYADPVRYYKERLSYNEQLMASKQKKSNNGKTI